MEIVTGFQGKNHVTAQQLSRLISGLAGDETYVLDTQDQLAIEVVSANKVTIATGDLIAQGTYFTNEAPEDLVIENGVTGLNRNDLIVCRYEKAEPAVDEDGNPDYTIPRIESGDWAVVKGTPSSGTPEDPSVVTASLQDPNTSLAEFPVYRIPIRGLSVGTPERIPPVIPSMREACDSLSQDGKQSGSGRVDCQANSIAESAVISFPQAYRYPPLVSVSLAFDDLMTPETAKDMEFTPFSITESGFRVKVRNGGAFAHAGKFDWQAYGTLAPEKATG